MTDPRIRQTWSQLNDLHEEVSQAFNLYLEAAARGDGSKEWAETRRLAARYSSKLTEFTGLLAALPQSSGPDRT
jgi:hypothetical protein